MNCVDYYSGGDKPYLVSGGDDRLVKIWDYQVRISIEDKSVHIRNVSFSRTKHVYKH